MARTKTAIPHQKSKPPLREEPHAKQNARTQANHAEAKRIVIRSLIRWGNIGRAVKATGYTRASIFLMKKADPVFAQAWDEAIELGTDALEREAVRRATKGVTRSRRLGQTIVKEKEYSDLLLIFLLKARRPDKYRERHSYDMNVNGTMAVEHKVQFYMPSNGREVQAPQLPAPVEGKVVENKEADDVAV